MKAMLFTQVRHASTLISRGLVESERAASVLFSDVKDRIISLCYLICYLFFKHIFSHRK